MIDNKELAAELNTDVQTLSLKCSKHRGSFLGWITRQILLLDYDRLPFEEREYLLDILRTLLTPGVSGGGIMSNLFNNGLLTYKNSYLVRLAQLHSRNNPFGIKL